MIKVAIAKKTSTAMLLPVLDSCKPCTDAEGLTWMPSTVALGLGDADAVAVAPTETEGLTLTLGLTLTDGEAPTLGDAIGDGDVQPVCAGFVFPIPLFPSHS